MVSRLFACSLVWHAIRLQLFPDQANHWQIMANTTIHRLYYDQYKENSRTRRVKYMATNRKTWWCLLLNTTQFSQWQRKKIKKTNVCKGCRDTCTNRTVWINHMTSPKWISTHNIFVNFLKWFFFIFFICQVYKPSYFLNTSSILTRTHS